MKELRPNKRLFVVADCPGTGVQRAAIIAVVPTDPQALVIPFAYGALVLAFIQAYLVAVVACLLG